MGKFLQYLTVICLPHDSGGVLSFHVVVFFFFLFFFFFCFFFFFFVVVVFLLLLFFFFFFFAFLCFCLFFIMETRLIKYTEHFTTKK